jgi:hypothetical protein
MKQSDKTRNMLGRVGYYPYPGARRTGPKRKAKMFTEMSDLVPQLAGDDMVCLWLICVSLADNRECPEPEPRPELCAHDTVSVWSPEQCRRVAEELQEMAADLERTADEKEQAIAQAPTLHGRPVGLVV